MLSEVGVRPCEPGLGQVIVDDLAEAQGQVRDDMDSGDGFKHGKLGDRRQRMGMKIERAGPGRTDTARADRRDW